MYIINSPRDVQDMARGAVVLGTGGGGDPYIGELLVAAEVANGNFPKIISCDEIGDDDFVLVFAGVGAPSILVENLLSKTAMLRVLARAEAHFDRRVDALLCMEIGGANSMMPLALGAISGVPVLDADGIGRALPQLNMTTFSIHGCPVTPSILMEERGNVVTIEASDDKMAEDISRAATIAMGAGAFCMMYPMSGKRAREVTIHGTISQTLEIGRAIREGRNSHGDPFDNLLRYLNSWPDRTAKIIFDGKIVDVTHEIRNGWHWGQARLQPLNGGGDDCVIEIQNEFTIARINGETATIVPDLITVLDRESAEPLTSDMLAYGQRVKVLSYSCDPVLRRPEALDVLGPRAFGFDEDFRPMEELLGLREPQQAVG
ncbi:protein of unknown function DUF917 [Rhizorhabdus wittichii RW1]|uniref:DUF917 domain-containing protein n=2 Tax=Rhizorhabdus wittichii TaxID=160791 RepID=A0A9J9LFZ5_RHIWR|nr:DUF917 domain-containing protein [Rhizorhabdus wittichii]ABQ70535.1 protein of unknown function DUF917 [Rhizorhabdus wittichii RW1]QTH23937.1 DUF917 domain-containing protein [Rhizorhabdus wittichii]